MAKEINNVISHNEVTHPKLSSYNERLQAYINLGCPIDLQQKPEKMAEAGFYYLGRSDKVGCFYCGGFLQHWQPSDDPWEEHAKAFSRCTFINLIKSPEYVRNITKDTKQITIRFLGHPIRFPARYKKGVKYIAGGLLPRLFEIFFGSAGILK